jgi:hypothetical protein
MAQFLRIAEISDVRGNPYFAINIPADMVQGFQKKLRQDIGVSRYAKALDNLQKRQGMHHHITVCLPFLDKPKSTSGFNGFTITDAEFLGIGIATQGDAQAYYIVVKSAQLDAFCDANGIPRKHWHVTIGFIGRDIHGVDKTNIDLV